MTGFLGNLRVDFRRAYFSFGFLVAVVGMCAALFLGISTEGYVINTVPNEEVLYFYMVAHAKGFSELSLIFAALPYATSFCTDWNSQFICSTLIRSDLKSYSVSKVFTCALAGGSAVVLGEGLFIFLLSLYFSLVNPQDPSFASLTAGDLFGSLLPL